MDSTEDEEPLLTRAETIRASEELETMLRSLVHDAYSRAEAAQHRKNLVLALRLTRLIRRSRDNG